MSHDNALSVAYLMLTSEAQPELSHVPALLVHVTPGRTHHHQNVFSVVKCQANVRGEPLFVK